jgi:hypothetical protein
MPEQLDPFVRDVATRLVAPSWSETESRWECSTDDFFFSSVGMNGPYLEADFYSQAGGMLTILLEQTPSWSPDEYFEAIAEVLRVTGAIKTNRIVHLDFGGAGGSLQDPS